MIAAGQQIGGYTVQRRIGGGQMGEVFLAQHRRIARRAAIKALIPELSAKDEVIERFFKQARQTSLLTHPGIIEILDCDLHEGQAYVVMEFLHGESLGTYLKRNGALAGDMAFLLGLVAQVAGAVGAAHDAGIMHRGLKPENIYLHVAPQPATVLTVKVLDFGVAQLSRDDSGRPRTTLGMMLGKPEYLSPEQCRGVGRPDERSDIYALGCIFYEALCGQPPFVGRSPAELIAAHVTAAPRPPIKLAPDLPPKLNGLILKMLAKSPDERPRAMSEVVESLRASARAMGIDFEGALESVVPVERPDVYGSGAEPPPAPSATPSSTPSGAPEDRPRPSPTSLGALPAPGSTASRQGSVARLADLMAAAAQSEELPFAPRASGTVPRTRVLDEDEPSPLAEAAIPAVGAGAPTSGALPATADAQSLRAAPERTLLYGGLPTTSQSQAAVRPEPEPGAAELNALAGLAGGTQVLKPSPASSSSSSRSASTARPPRLERTTPPGSRAEPRVISLNDLAASSVPVRPEAEPGAAELNALAGLAGGTQVLKPSKGRSSRPASDPPPASAPEPAGRRAAPTPARTVTIVISRAVNIWQQKPRLMVGLAAGGVLLAVGLAVTLPSGHPSPSANNPATENAEAPSPAIPPARAPAPVFAPTLREPKAPSATRALVAAPPAEAVEADNVRIEVRGLPAGTEVTLDGRPVELPLLVPRGGASHRMTLRTPDGVEEALDVRGTKDRSIDWHPKAAAVAVAEPALSPPPTPVTSGPPPPPAAAVADPPVPAGAVVQAAFHEAAPAKPATPPAKPEAPRADVDPLTDL